MDKEIVALEKKSKKNTKKDTYTINEYLNIKDRVYSPKEALAYFIVSERKAKEKNVDNIVTILKEKLIRNIENKDIVEKIELTTFEKITNYWALSIEQVISYGYIVFNTLKFEEEPFTEEKICDMFNYSMRLYSPNNAVDYFKSKLKQNEVENI